MIPPHIFSSVPSTWYIQLQEWKTRSKRAQTEGAPLRCHEKHEGHRYVISTGAASSWPNVSGIGLSTPWLRLLSHGAFKLNFYNRILFFHHATFWLQNCIFLPPLTPWVSQNSLNEIWDIGKEQVGEIGEDWSPDPVTVRGYKYMFQNEKEWWRGWGGENLGLRPIFLIYRDHFTSWYTVTVIALVQPFAIYKMPWASMEHLERKKSYKNNKLRCCHLAGFTPEPFLSKCGLVTLTGAIKCYLSLFWSQHSVVCHLTLGTSWTWASLSTSPRHFLCNLHSPPPTATQGQNRKCLDNSWWRGIMGPFGPLKYHRATCWWLTPESRGSSTIITEVGRIPSSLPFGVGSQPPGNTSNHLGSLVSATLCDYLSPPLCGSHSNTLSSSYTLRAHPSADLHLSFPSLCLESTLLPFIAWWTSSHSLGLTLDFCNKPLSQVPTYG